MKKTKNRAFTLIELLVVIVIIGILSTISVAAFAGYLEDARLAKAQAAYAQTIKQIKTAVSLSDDFRFTRLYSFDGPDGVSQTSPYVLDTSGSNRHFTGIEGPGSISEETDLPLAGGNGIRLDNIWIRRTGNSNTAEPKITIGAWMKVNEITRPYGYPFGFFTRTGFILRNTGKLEFYFGSTNKSIISSNNLIKDGRWHYVLGSYDGTTLRMWVDGDLIGERDEVIAPTSISNITLGHYPTMDISFDDIIVLNGGFDGKTLR